MSASAHHKDGGNAYRCEMDKVLEKNPPQIVWRTNGRGVQEAVFLDDPHTDRPWPKNRDYNGDES